MKRLSPVLVLALLGACTQGGTTQEDISADTLFSYYMDNHDEYAVIVNIRHQLENLCLTELGVKDQYLPEVAPVPDRDGIEDYLYHPRRPTKTEADLIGYHDLYALEVPLPAVDEREAEVRQVVYSALEAPAEITQYPDSAVKASGLDVKAAEAFWKTTPGSCAEAVNDAILSTTTKKKWDLYTSLNQDISNSNNAKFINTQDEWINCVNDQWYNNVSGFGEVFHLYAQYRAGIFTEEEFESQQKDLAMKDYSCAKSLDTNTKLMESYETALREMIAGKEVNFFNASLYFREVQERIEQILVRQPKFTSSPSD